MDPSPLREYPSMEMRPVFSIENLSLACEKIEFHSIDELEHRVSMRVSASRTCRHPLVPRLVHRTCGQRRQRQYHSTGICIA